LNEHRLRGRGQRLPKIGIEDSQPLDFQAFHALYRGRYVRWAQLYLGSRDDAEDAVHEAVLELLAQWDKILRQPQPAAYAWCLVKNRVRDAARARSRRQKLTDAVFATAALYGEATDPIGELENTLSLWEAIDDLPERQHDVFLLRHNLDYSTREVAEVLGITEATVRSTLRAARHCLADKLGIDSKKGHDDARNVD
jgi:RNA polymerase sigma-70 factor (ECF subfamily)